MPLPRHHSIYRITSSSNSLIKVFRRALKEGITPDGLLAVEGPLVLREIQRFQVLLPPTGLLRCKSTIRSALISDDYVRQYSDLLHELTADVEMAQTPDSIFRTVVPTVSPQGIAALVEVSTPDLASVSGQENVLLVLAAGLQDPGNLGTIARAAEAFGAGALLALKATVSPFNPKAVRSSGGAAFRLPMYAGLDADRVFRGLAGAGIRVAAADPRGDAVISSEDLCGPLAILIGNEAAGLDDDTARRAQLRLRIPIRPEVDSINAAMSAGILLYEAARQRGFRY
jgi:TrmH family RNA methyltransferase